MTDQMHRDIEEWSKDKLEQWYKDSLVRFKIIDSSYDDAMSSVTTVLWWALANIMALQTENTPSHIGVEFAKLIRQIRKAAKADRSET